MKTEAELDNEAIDAFAAAIKKRLAYKRSERGGNYTGWQDMEDWELEREAKNHLISNKIVSAAAYLVFLWNNRRVKNPGYRG